MKELGLSAGDIFAYEVTGGSNLDLPDLAVTPEGRGGQSRTGRLSRLRHHSLYLYLLCDGSTDRPRQEVWFSRGYSSMV